MFPVPTMELRSGRNGDNATSAPAGGSSSTQASTPAAPTYVTIPLPPLNPGVFTGVGNPDVDDWLRLYEHASTIHRWDSTIMLANVLSYLDGTPWSSCQTHEDRNYMVAPIPVVMLAHGITVPHTVLTITGNRTCLALVNLALSVQVLPQGFSLAVIRTLQDHQVEPFTVEDCCSSSPYCDVIPRQWRRH